ncbi:MAG: hypothetical protein FJW31_06425 [Acidobacteria bacterium]|nr:hypothetical protein [Acidobacteriota bacterium]
MPLQFSMPSGGFAAVRSRMRCLIDVVCLGDIAYAHLYHPDDQGPAIGVALLEDSAFEALDRSYHFSNKQLEALSRINSILQEANVRWLVTDVERWPVEVAVPASRFSTLAFPDVPGVSFVPMDDAALHRALFDRSLAHFRMVGAACDARGVDWAVTSTRAMLLHGLPEWPESNSHSALVSDLGFHEKLPLPPGVHVALGRFGGGGQVMFAYPAFPLVYFWQWSAIGWGDVLSHAVVRNGLKAVPVEMLLADSFAYSAPSPVLDAFAARRDDIDWPLADLFACRHGSDTRAALNAFRGSLR